MGGRQARGRGRQVASDRVEGVGLGAGRERGSARLGLAATRTAHCGSSHRPSPGSPPLRKAVFVLLPIMLRAVRTLRSSRSSSSLFVSRFTPAGVQALSFSQQRLNQRAFLQTHPTGSVSASIISFPTFIRHTSYGHSFATSNAESPKTISEDKASTKKVSRIRQIWKGSKLKVYWDKYGMTFAGEFFLLGFCASLIY